MRNNELRSCRVLVKKFMFSQNDILRSICDVYWFILPHDKPRLCVDKQRVKIKTHGRHKQWRVSLLLSYQTITIPSITMKRRIISLLPTGVK